MVITSIYNTNSTTVITFVITMHLAIIFMMVRTKIGNNKYHNNHNDDKEKYTMIVMKKSLVTDR